MQESLGAGKRKEVKEIEEVEELCSATLFEVAARALESGAELAAGPAGRKIVPRCARISPCVGVASKLASR